MAETSLLNKHANDSDALQKELSEQNSRRISNSIERIEDEIQQKEAIDNLKQLRDSLRVTPTQVDTRPWAARQCKWINGRKFCPE